MNFNATYLEKRMDDEQGIYLTFKPYSWADKQIIKELEKGAIYRLKLVPVKAKRSQEQNNYMWALIHEISVAENGEMATSEDDWEIYIRALEKAQAKFEYVACLPEAEPLIKQQFRAVKEMNEFEHNGRTFKQLKVFYGSSKMDVKEMAKLLDVVIGMAQENGIDLVTKKYE